MHIIPKWQDISNQIMLRIHDIISFIFRFKKFLKPEGIVKHPVFVVEKLFLLKILKIHSL